MDVVTLAAAKAADKLVPETLGAKLRRLSRAAQNNNSWTRPYMKSVGPWTPSTAVLVRAMCVNGGNLYVCGVAGTTASTGGPTGTTGNPVTDGTAKWYYFGPNQVTQDPATSTPAWAASTAYTLGQQVTNSSGVYAVVVAGTSAGSGGPTTLTNSITDNTVTWTYMGPTYTNPYLVDFITYSFASSAPAEQTNLYVAGSGSNFTALPQCSVIAGGSGYVVGEVITLTGGTFTTAAQVTVTAVSSGAVTAVSVTRAGAYTSLPATLPVAQGSTSGSGTGATFYVHFSQPSWCRVRGGDPARLQSGSWLIPACVQVSAGANDTWVSTALEFMTDSPKVTLQLLQNLTTIINFAVVVDGVRYNLAPPDQPVTASNNNFYSFSPASGRKVRHWRIEGDVSVGFSLPPVRVDAASSVWAPDDQDYIKAAIVGDSITISATPGPYVTGNSVTLALARELGWVDCRNLGVGTTGWVHQNPVNTGGNQFGYRITQMIPSQPDVWVFIGSWNDLAETPSAVTAAVTAKVAEIRASGSRAPLIFIGVWSANASGSGGNAAIAATEAAVQAGAATDSLGRSYFIPIYGDPHVPWLTGTWNNNPTPNGWILPNAINSGMYLDTTNSPHPSDLGIVYMARRQASAIRKYVLPSLV